MKKKFRLGAATLCMILCCAILFTQFPGYLKASAVVAGTDPSIDPSINTAETLPEEYDQALTDGLPYGYFVVDDSAIYSFGTAVDSKGNLYTASYSKGTISVRSKDAFGYISLLSEEKTIKLTPCIFGLAITADDNIVYSVCYDTDGYVAIYDQTTGVSTTVINGLTRPNDCCVDGNDNVYVACENGVVAKWEKSTGKVSTVASGLGALQSVVVDADGVVYALSYSIASDTPLIGVAIRGGTLYQINTDSTIERVAGNNNQYVWRSRGLAIDENGYILLTGEANAWDNGNSALIARYDPRTRTIEQVTAGMDYFCYVAYGDDGRIYGSLARDNKTVAYSEKAASEFKLQSGWSSVGDSRIITYGGTYTNDSNSNLKIKVGSLEFSGSAATHSNSNKISGWISIPADSLPEISKEDKDGDLRGVYSVPDVTITSSTGTAKSTVMVLREHVRSRWPMVDLYTNAEDFSEAPEAYLVYFEWTPENIENYVDTAENHDIYRTMGIIPAAGAYNGNTLGELDFSDSDAATTADEETGITQIELSGKTAYTRYVGNDMEIAFRIDESVGDWLGISIDNRQSSSLGEGVGVRALLWENGSVTARMVNSYENLGWDAAATTQTLYDGSVGSGFADGKWHTLRMTNNFGEWDIFVDNVCITSSAYEGFDDDMLELAGGTATYITLYSATSNGTVSVRKATDEDSAQETSKLTFQSRGDAWNYDLETGVYSTVGLTNTHYITGDFKNGVEFEFQSSGISDFMFMNIGNASAVFPDGDDFFYDFCHGTGLKVLPYASGQVNAKLITATGGDGWNGAPWSIEKTGVASAFHDGTTWHKVSISKASGKWVIKVDGVDILADIDDTNRATLNSLLDGDTGYLVFGSNGYSGTIKVKDSATASSDSVEDLNKLDLKIQVAKNLYNNTYVGNNYGQVSKSAKEALAVAGKAAVAVAEKTNSSASEITAAINKLQTAIDAFKSAIIESCDFTDLATMITSAQTMFDKASVGTGVGQVPQTNYDEMKTAIANAIKTYSKHGVTQDELDNELESLVEVVSRFASSVVVDDTPYAFDWITRTSATATDSENETGVTNLVLPISGSDASTEVNPINLTFSIRINPNQNFEWFSIALANDGANRLGGNGVCGVFWLDYKADVRVIETVSGKGWDGEGLNKQVWSGTLVNDNSAITAFNDGEWHEFKLSRAENGSWNFTCDGIELFANKYDGFYSDLDRLIGGGNTVTMNIYTNSAYGEIDIYQDTTGAKVSFGALNTLIEQAESLIKDTDKNRAPESAFADLQSAVDSANAVKAIESVTYTQVTEAKKALQAAINKFVDIVKLTYDSIEFENDVAAFGTEVSEDNLYDALLILDAWSDLTSEQQAMVSKDAVAAMEALRADVYKLLRSENGVTISGDNLAYYVRILVSNYNGGKLVDDTYLSFKLDAEDWLTYGSYTLGQDGEFTVTVELPDKVADGTKFNVNIAYSDGTVAIVAVTAKDNAVVFTAKEAATISVSAVKNDAVSNVPNNDSNNTTNDNKVVENVAVKDGVTDKSDKTPSSDKEIDESKDNTDKGNNITSKDDNAEDKNDSVTVNASKKSDDAIIMTVILIAVAILVIMVVVAIVIVALRKKRQ